MHAIQATLCRLALALMLTLAVAIFLPGCGGIHGGSTAETDVHSTTVGQELLDLEKARQAGVISDKDYEKQKKKILDRK
jgi:uncharacterized protein YceK